ncbi:MAG: carbon-nitrogen hydrolase family protein [Mangrovibacterium sp.]
MKLALASPPIPKSLAEGLKYLEEMVKEAALQNADIICFPESYLPGYPGMGYPAEDQSEQALKNALGTVQKAALENRIAVIIPMDWHNPEGLQNLAFVIDSDGKVLGHQTKNQLDPSEDTIWIAGTERQLFEVKGVKFGITICHEGFRYPESVRWAAQNGAKIVFHPHFSSSSENIKLSQWGSAGNPYYEKAMMMRSIENTIYFASINYTSDFQESATSLINPDGTCLGYQEYGKPGLFVADINPELATGYLARRFKKWLYR